MTATITSISEVLESVETDLPDPALQRLINGAEDDVRHYLSNSQLKTLPCVVWSGRYTPVLGDPNGSLTLLLSILGFPFVRFEGTVALNMATPVYTADTDELGVDGGTDTIIPVTAGGIAVPDGGFVATIDSTGLILTIDTTLTTAAITITRVLALQTLVPPVQMVNAVLDLVMLGVRYRGIEEEEVGEYNVTLQDYHSQRGKVLKRLIFTGGTSLAR